MRINSTTLNLLSSERRSYLLIIVATILFAIFVNIYVLQVPVFADGTQHTWITEYVQKNGFLPKTDITGIQPANFAIPYSIPNSQPFLYQPLFYVLSGGIAVLINNADYSIDLINIVSLVLTSLTFFLLMKEIFNQKVAIFSFIMIILSNIWPWMIVHRIVEPLIIALFSVLTYFIYRYLKGNRIYLYLTALQLSVLFTLKQSVYPIIFSTFVVIFLKRKIKDIFIFCILTFLLFIPSIFFAVSSSGSALPRPIGLNIIDNAFPNAWWNQNLAEWEIELDSEVNTPSLRKYTYQQFKQVQKSPYNLVQGYGINGLLNQFSLYSLSLSSTEGFQSPIPNILAPLFLLIFSLIIPSLYFFRHSLYKNSFFFIFVFFLFLSVLALWYQQPVFRYYIYIVIFSVFLYAMTFYFISINSFKFARAFSMTLLLVVIVINLSYELMRDLSYNYTAMHQLLPSTQGGLSDSIKFSQKIADKNSNEFIFTPMVEIAYYSHKKYLWDHRLFFVTDEARLLSYLKHYNFRYVVLPFYSNTTTLANWDYTKGTPSDSTFSKLLNNPEYFNLVEDNNTFKAYKKLF